MVFFVRPNYAQEKEKGFIFKEKANQIQDIYPDSAIYYSLQALEYFWKNGNLSDFLECRLYLQLYYENIGNEANGDSIAKLNWEFAQKFISPTNPKDALNYVYSATNRAAGLVRMGETLTGIQIYEKVFPVIEKVKSQNPQHISYMYLHAANCYDLLGDYQQSLSLNQKVLRNPQLREIHPLSIFYAQSNIGFSYLERYELSLALEAFSKLDSIYFIHSSKFPNLHEHSIYLYRGKSQVFHELGEVDSALLYARKAFSLVHYERASNDQATIYNILGAALLKKKRFKEAYEVLRKSLQLNNPEGEDYFALTSRSTYMLLADYYISQGQLGQAEQALNRALLLCSRKKAGSSFDSEDYPSKFKALETLVEKISLYGQPLKLNLKTTAIKEIHLGKELIHQIRKSFQLMGSKLNLAKLSHRFFEATLLTPLALNIEDKFNLIEEGKSILLYEALLEQEAQLGLPHEMKKREKNFKRDLAYYEKSLFDEQNGEIQNSEKIAALQDSVYALQQRYNSFQDTLESDYPSYYQQKYNLELASLEEIENQLKVNEAFLQYFVGDSSIFVMGIHPEKQVFQRIPFTDSLLSPIQAYLEFLSSPNELSSEERGDTYVQNAHMLYKTLLAPVLSQLPEEIDRLIISPDGILSYIPFEALIEELPQEEWRYSDLPYLIHSHAISYTHSATHWLEQQEPSEQIPPHNWLGFAPSYEEVQITESVQPLALNRFLTRDGSVQLPHAQEEISRISEMIGGQGFFQTSALESDFHREADQYQVLHLATHGLVEDQQPLYSKLVFAPEDDSVYDGFLHAYEIYNMRLPANLVVLSACNTGVGKLEKGEGIMSLSRAFFYAGVKSLLMSLWKVSDESTSELMVSFYEGLKAGEDKDLALQQAKVEYIQNQEIAMKSHPYFWAGFVLKGDAGALSLKSSRGYWGYFLLGFLVLLGLVFGVRSSRKKLGD